MTTPRTAYVAGMAFTPDGDSVWLVLKKKPAWQAGLFNAIGGHVEPGEEPLDAMKREANEEASMPLDLEWEPVVVLYGPDYVVHFYRVTWDGEAVARTQEPIVLIETNKIGTAPMIENLRWIIPFARDRQTLNAYTTALPIVVHEEVI